MNSIAFPKSVPVGKFEELIRKKKNQPDSPILLDFSKSTFIEMATLQMVNSIVAKREQINLETKIALPKGKSGRDARDALRAWKWPRALQTISTRKFEELVTEEDQANFKALGGDEGASAYNIHSNSTRSITFQTWRIADYRDKIRISDEIVELEEFKPVLQVLNRRLKPPVGYDDSEIADHMMSRIVFEAMTNAIRHPKARFIQVASTIRETPYQSAFFTITFWDDGNSIWRTVKDACEKENALGAKAHERFKTFYKVKSENWDTSIFKDGVVTSEVLPTGSSSPEHFFLSSLFPGVTSDHTGQNEVYYKTLKQEAPELARRGMGLFALVRAAVHTFGGTVSFRNSGLFMNVKKNDEFAESPNHFSVKLTGSYDDHDDFMGNMITIRLPLRKI